MGELKETNKYVCLEGMDGSGKTTLATKLLEHLGDKAYAVRFPSDGVIGSQIRRFLSGADRLPNAKAMLHLFAADGYMEDPALRRALGERHLICDRHPTLSGRVYQLEHHQKAHIDRVYDTVDLLRPDHLFVIDVPPEVSLERRHDRDKYEDVVYESEDLERLQEIRDLYMEMLLSARRGWAKNAVWIDGRRPIKELVAQVIQIAGLE